MKTNISLSTALPWWPDKAERKLCEVSYLLPVPWAIALEVYFVNSAVG